MARLKNLLVALDQFLFCVVTFGRASPDETASAAAWRLEQEGRWQGKVFRPLLDAMMWFDKDHCRESYRSELLRAQLPKGYRQC